VVKYGTNASGTIWWPNLQLMQLVPSGGQFGTNMQVVHPVAKLATYASGAICWPNLQPIQEVSLKSISNYSS